MKKILITGASGFIGSYLTEGALERGYETWAGIRASSSQKYLQDTRLQFIDLPYSDTIQLREVLLSFLDKHGKWDVIIHNAGLTQCVDYKDFYQVNYENTKRFVEILMELEMVPERFLYMSSLSVFGPGDEKSMTPILLSDIPHPNTEYGKSKLKSEDFLASLKDFPSLILRPTGVYGPREKDYFLLIKTVRMGLDVSVGYKPQKITFIYVKDLVKAAYIVIEKAESGSSYFVSDGFVYTSSDYTRFVMKKLNLKYVFSLCIPLFLVHFISTSVGALMHCLGKPFTLNSDKYKIMKQRNWCCETTPLEKLGFKADYDLERGVNESIDWYNENKWL